MFKLCRVEKLALWPASEASGLNKIGVLSHGTGRDVLKWDPREGSQELQTELTHISPSGGLLMDQFSEFSKHISLADQPLQACLMDQLSIFCTGRAGLRPADIIPFPAGCGILRTTDGCRPAFLRRFLRLANQLRAARKRLERSHCLPGSSG